MPRIKKTITEALSLPKEVMFGLPYLTLTGKEEILIENHKGIIWADCSLMKIKSSCGIINITGKCLSIREISPGSIRVSGNIEKLEFLI
ncbi:MAG: sporulation protein YqfC [Firmicutes bacterium]|nr:sporulation protein YqfC [Bacillota bacterium]MBQ7241411.1 sporulation protein YqfC [Bacillota bacterium]MBR0104966.1 sporulation protein YqfC [Bacillota bacterium]MBR2594191.1 sporulation protein YqfC [Bacillota bacterium]